MSENFNNRITSYDELPTEIKYFQEANIVELTRIPQCNPEISTLTSITVLPKVVSTKLISTPIALSYEGQNLSGYKLIVQLSIEEKIKYVAKVDNESVHATYFCKNMKSVFVVVPKEINGRPIEDLIRTHCYAVVPYVENTYTFVKDPRTIYKSVSLLVDVKFFD